MTDDWTDVSSPEDRVQTITESMLMSRTVEWVAEQAHADERVARDVLEDMVDDGVLVTWTGGREQVYATNEGKQLVDYLRDIGKETDDGILVPHEVVEELEAGRGQQ